MPIPHFLHFCLHGSSRLPFKCLHFLLLSALLLINGGCGDSPAEQVVKENISELATAIENKKTSQAVDFFHENFVTEKGQDKQWVERTMLLHTIRHANIQLLLSNISVELLDATTARASFHVIATGGQGLIPDEGSAYRMETEWREKGGDWYLVFAKWKKALGP